MARSPTSGIAAHLTAPSSYPGKLVQIVAGATTYRLATFDADFSFDGHTWVSSDVEVAGLEWTTGGTQGASMTLGDTTLAWWTLVINLTLQDAAVSIWQAYAEAATEALALWSGRIGSCTKGDGTVVCGLVPDATLLRSPRRRVQNLVSSLFLAAPGTTYIINDQRWTLVRRTDA